MSSEGKTKLWKQKALERAKEIHRLRKQLREVRASREKWKKAHGDLKAARVALGREKPASHHYPVALVWLCLHVYNTCLCSFRSCCEIVVAGALLLQIKCRRPCAASVRNWVIKYGYYCSQHRPREYTGPWALIVDESVSIGQEKLLLLLGLPLEPWSFDRPVSHPDVRVLHLGIAASWKAEAIQEVLQKVASSVQVSYCVSDKGNNIMGAMKALGWRHVYDCSHQWAKLLEQLYGRCVDFTTLTAALSKLRKQWVLSRHAHLMPPALRSKARFQNIFPLVAWMERIKAHWAKLDRDAKEKLAFVEVYKNLIAELVLLKQVIGQMSQVLKVKGMNKTTLRECRSVLARLSRGRPLQFRTRLEEAWAEYAPLLKKQRTLLCCSDIIESYFGRFKQRIRRNNLQALTETTLMMGGWSETLTKETVQTALTQVAMKDVYAWKKKHTMPSLCKKRKMFFAESQTKKQPAV